MSLDSPLWEYTQPSAYRECDGPSMGIKKKMCDFNHKQNRAREEIVSCHKDINRLVNVPTTLAVCGGTGSSYTFLPWVSEGIQQLTEKADIGQT